MVPGGKLASYPRDHTLSVYCSSCLSHVYVGVSGDVIYFQKLFATLLSLQGK